MAASDLCMVALVASVFVLGQTAITSQPEDVATASGRDVKINCSIDDNTPLQWSLTRPNSDVPTTLFLSLDGSINNPTKHGIEGKYDMVVKDSQPVDGGKYTCKYFTQPVTEVSAQFYVFEPLSCGTDEMEAVEGDNVTMFCHSVYGGAREPTVQLTGTTSAMETRTTTNSNTTSQWVSILTTLVVTSEDHRRDIVCHVALNRPAYNDNCTITLNVQFAPKNISIYPSNWTHFYVDEQIMCNATGNPEPTYQWENLNGTEEIISGDTLTITSAMMGNNTWRCIAMNMLNDNATNSSIEFNFSVGEGERPTVGPVSGSVHLESFTSCWILSTLLAILLASLLCKH